MYKMLIYNFDKLNSACKLEMKKLEKKMQFFYFNRKIREALKKNANSKSLNF